MSLFAFDDGEKRREVRGSDYDLEGFNVFWRDYPRKEARKDAVKAWNQARPTSETQREIGEALIWQSQQKNWLENRRFIPLPASYLRGERWKDERPQTIGVDRRSDFQKARDLGYRTSTERLKERE